RLDRFSPGKYLLHNRLGVGKVTAWSLAKQKIQIDFEQEPKCVMGLKLAFNQLTLLPEGHFLVTCYERADECKRLAEDKDQMLHFIRMVLSSNFSLREGIDEKLPMLPEDLERFLSGRVIPAQSWKSWWERARAAMRDDPGFRLPTKRGEAIVLRKAESAAEALLDDYEEAKTLESCVRILDLARMEVLEGQFDVVAKLIKVMAEDIDKDRSEPQHVLELIIIRDEIIANLSTTEEKKAELEAALAAVGADSFVTLADKLKSISSEEMVGYIGELSVPRQRLVYEALPMALGESWLAYTTNIFLFGGAKTTAPVADFIIAKGEKEQLFADLLNGLSRQSLSADVLIWICRERAGLAKELVDKSKMALGSAILNAIERDSLEGGPNRALRLRNLLIDDKSLAPDLIAGLSEPEARPFAKGVYDSSVLADLDRNLLLANMMKVHPGLQAVVLSRTKTKEKQVTYVSLRSYEARKAEYEDLINVRIPKNKHDLEITRAEGDLRENGGYQDAKATRQVLMRRSEELSRLLVQAEPTDFAGTGTDITAMGTSVSLRTEKGDEVVYTILGAWDSDPDNHVIPYSSRQGQKLCGLSVGDSIRLPLESGQSPVKMTVVSIALAPSELIFPDQESSEA
ncbi:MAG: GreA/GreB family elongation factor, partial [Akkermansia sp.]